MPPRVPTTSPLSRAEVRELIGFRLWKARSKLGLKQVEVAALLARPQGYVSDVESGQRKVTVDHHWQFGVVLRLPMNALVRSPTTVERAEMTRRKRTS